MGYGGGIGLIAIGLILALAVNERTIGPVDIGLVGWILAAAGLALVLITALQANSRRRSVARTTHADGSQTVRERTDQDPPPMG